MAAMAPMVADGAAVPDGSSFCIPPPLLLLLSVFCPAPLLWFPPPCFSTACCCHSCCLPACLLVYFTHPLSPPFAAFPLPCSPFCSALDYEIFSSFAAVQSCVTKKTLPTYIAVIRVCVHVWMITQVVNFCASWIVCTLVVVCVCASVVHVTTKYVGSGHI